MNKREIRDVERTSIRDFVLKNDIYLAGRVLDFGCGTPSTCVKPQPYRGIVEAVHARMGAGEYVPYEKGEPLPDEHFDCVLMTQVLQYVKEPWGVLVTLRDISDHLVMTYPTHWEEVESQDLRRFTKCGMEALLDSAGWTIEVHQARWSLPFDDFKLVGGYGVVARR